MANVKIGTTTMDILSALEMRDVLTHHQANWFKERARGIKPMRFPVALAAISGGSVTIPSDGNTAIAPNPGFSWAVHRISVAGMATGDVVKIYINNVNDMNFVGQVSFTSPTFFPGDTGFIIHEGDRIVLNGTGLTATGDITVSGEVVEVPTVDVWKICGG